MIPFLWQHHVTTFDGWKICGNDEFKLRKGRPRNFWNIYGYDWPCMNWQRFWPKRPIPMSIYTRSIHTRIFPFLHPPVIFSVFAIPTSPHKHIHPSVLSSSCKPVTAQLTLYNEKSKIKILLGERIIGTNKKWQKNGKKTFSRNSNS